MLHALTQEFQTLALLVNMSSCVPYPPPAGHQVPRQDGVMVAFPPRHLELATLLAELDNMASRTQENHRQNNTQSPGFRSKLSHERAK